MKKIITTLCMLSGVYATAGPGGICFRMDDNQNPQKWRDVAAVFNKHKQKLCTSLNIRRMGTPDIEMLLQLQHDGHEVMDHTPLHNISQFKFAPGKGTKDYQDKPGVDHISGNTVYLKFVNPSPKDSIAELKVSFAKDKLTLIDKPDDKTAKQIRDAKVLYIPSAKKVLQLYRTKNPNEFTLRSVWGEKNVNENGQTKACFFKERAFWPTPEALELLGRNALELFAHYQAKRPYTWIQPGGGVSCISSELVRKVLGERLGYKSAATYVGNSKKVFNEYDPKKNCAYGMMWGDFDEERHDLQWNKSRISDLVALHHVAIGHSHMHPKDGWDKYLERLDKLLAWCVEKKIPVRTQSEWADILYNQKNDPGTSNVFPSMLTDLDENGIPDGYTLRRKDWWDSNKNRVVSKRSGEIFSVKQLAGLGKGKNSLVFSVDSAKGTQLEVKVSFPGTRNKVLKKVFDIKPGKMKKCTWAIAIPKDVSMADFTWSSKNNDTTEIYDISLTQSL